MGRLATGGMGEVYLARQEGPAGFVKTVVVKRILDSYASDETFLQMFVDEARLAALLSHPNIVQIFELGEEAGSYYIAMEYVHGHSLRAVKRELSRRRQAFDALIAARLCEHALKGLHYAHELKDEAGRPLHLVHRDISPENILVGFNGVVKLVDFGIAKATVNLNTTRNGALKGKFHYMAPELVMGGRATVRSDLYSMGVVLYELLTGERPFNGNSPPELLQAIVRGQFTPPREVNPDIPKRMSDIVAGALAKNPADRFPSAEKMELALEEFIQSSSQRVAEPQIAALLRDLYGAVDNPASNVSFPRLAADGGALLAPPRSGAGSAPPPSGSSAERAGPAAATPLPPPPPPGAHADLLSGSALLSDLEIDVLPPEPPAPQPHLVPSEHRRQLVVVNTHLAGLVFELSHSPVSVGRSATSELRLDHPSVASSAGLFFFGEEREWTLIDVSGRGIRVNGVAQERATLSRGDAIRIGGVELLVSASVAAPEGRGEVAEQAGVAEPFNRGVRSGAARARRADAADDSAGRGAEGAPENPWAAGARSDPQIPPGMVRVRATSLASAYGGQFDVAEHWMDRTPVTNAQYAAFLEATGEVPPSHWMGRRPPPGEEQHPVVGVPLSAARHYARWKGARLPTNLEWEAAARGPELRRFPWGEAY